MNSKRGVGVPNFNGSSDPDIISGSLPYMECQNYIQFCCSEARLIVHTFLIMAWQELYSTELWS